MNLKEFKNTGHPPTLFSAFLYFDTSFMVWVLLGPLAVFIAEDFHLSPAQKGMLVALPVLGGAAMRLVLGVMTDRIGAKKTALTGLAVTLVPLLWGWLGGTTLTQMHCIGLLLGVAGASFAAALPMASRWYPPEQQGLAMGIAGAGNSGTVLAALVAPRIAKHYGGNWHEVFAFAILPVTLTWFVVALLARDSSDRPAPRSMNDYLAVLRQPDTLWFCLFYSITFGGFVGMSSYVSTLLTTQYAMSKVDAGLLMSLFALTGAVIRPVGGWLADRVTGVRALLVLLAAISALDLLFAALMPPVSGCIAILLGLYLCFGLGNGSTFQLVPQRWRGKTGVMTGVIGAAGGIGGFYLPVIMGIAKETTNSYQMGFVTFGVLAAAAFVLVVALRQQWLSWAVPEPAAVQDEMTLEAIAE